MDAVLTWIIVGGVAGLLANWLMSNMAAGCLGSVVIGIVGAVIGGFLFQILNVPIPGGLLTNIGTAFVGSVILLGIVQRVGGA